MTRINLVPPKELIDVHLITEYRELPRVFTLVAKAQARGFTPDKIKAPADYVLGKGHVKFFYNKLAFLEQRFDALVAEMIIRGMKPRWRKTPAYDLLPHWKNNYKPTTDAVAINRERIIERREEYKRKLRERRANTEARRKAHENTGGIVHSDQPVGKRKRNGDPAILGGATYNSKNAQNRSHKAARVARHIVPHE